MQIGVCFYGSLYGVFPTRFAKGLPEKDFRHCWPNLKKNIVDPFLKLGHQVDIFVSSYRIQDPVVEEEFFDLFKPKATAFSKLAGADPFTSKYATFENISNNTDLDFIVMCRLDLHFNKQMAHEDIDFNKFNILFWERGFEHVKFACDNFYMWPHTMTPIVERAMRETYRYPRGYADTHALPDKLMNYVPADSIHAIGKTPELSNINTFFTICKQELANAEDLHLIHPEVSERFKTLI